MTMASRIIIFIFLCVFLMSCHAGWHLPPHHEDDHPGRGHGHGHHKHRGHHY